MRDLPYFPLYASTQLADKNYRLMTLPERGLWISILMECWPNLSVPSNPIQLAKYLGLPLDAVTDAMTPSVLAQFKEVNGTYVSQEIDEYRAEVKERRAKQSAGGKEGARRKSALKEKQDSNPLDTYQPNHITSEPEGGAIGVPKGSLSQVQSNQINSNQLAKGGIYKDESWVEELETSISTMKDVSAFAR